MPIFRSTYNIFNDYGEIFDDNWTDKDTLFLPETKEWDYKRDLKIEEIEIWEVLAEGIGFKNIYAAWKPYAEFYLIVDYVSNTYETIYGAGSNKKVKKVMEDCGIPVFENKIWVDPDKEWLYH